MHKPHQSQFYKCNSRCLLLSLCNSSANSCGTRMTKASSPFCFMANQLFNHHQLKICSFLEAVKIQLPGLLRVISGTTSLFHGCNYLFLGGHPVLIAAALEQALELEECSEFFPLPPSSLVLFIFP